MINKIKQGIKELQNEKTKVLSEMKKAQERIPVCNRLEKEESISRYYHLRSFASGMDMGIQKMKSILRSTK